MCIEEAYWYSSLRDSQYYRGAWLLGTTPAKQHRYYRKGRATKRQLYGRVSSAFLASLVNGVFPRSLSSTSHQEFLPHFDHFREYIVSCSVECAPARVLQYQAQDIHLKHFVHTAQLWDIVALAFGDSGIEPPTQNWGIRLDFYPNHTDGIDDSHAVIEDPRNILLYGILPSLCQAVVP